MYSVFPEPSVRYVPSGPDRVTTVIDEAPPLAEPVAPPPAAAVVPPPEPPELEHAESTRPAARAAPTAQLRAPPANRRVTIALIPFRTTPRTPAAGWVCLSYAADFGTVHGYLAFRSRRLAVCEVRSRCR